MYIDAAEKAGFTGVGLPRAEFRPLAGWGEQGVLDG